MKKSKFLNIFKSNKENGEEVYLLHSTIRGSMIKAKCPDSRSVVDALESQDIFEYDEENEFHKALKDTHMLVDDNVNEMHLLNYYYFESSRDVLYVIPIVTRQCNFRCVYCYEEHENKNMNSEIYENLLLAIKKEVEHKRYKFVSVSFFGGEPLLEFEAICDFMEKAQNLSLENDFQIYGWATTNAYSLSLDKLEKLVKLGVTHYQITVDGLKETHDKNRFLISGGGTWDVIIGNLVDAKNSDLDFNITIRTNFDSSLAEDFERYLEFLSENFSDDSRFKFHFEAVKNLGIEPDIDIVEQHQESDATMRMVRLAKKKNLDIQFAWAPFGDMCYASRNSSLVVDTDGTLLKCTVRIDSPENFVGKLTDNGFEIDDVKICEWTSYNLPKECLNCSILPLCYGRKCPPTVWGSKILDPNYCESRISLYENHLRTLILEG